MDCRSEPRDDVQFIHVTQRRDLWPHAEDHQREQLVGAQPAVLEVIEIVAEFVGQEEARARDDPAVGVAVEEDLAHPRQLDRRGIAEEQVPEAHKISRRIERVEMLLQVGPLNELAAILLIDRHEHAQDVLEQVAATLGQAVEEQRAGQTVRREAKRVLVERIGFDGYEGHVARWRLAWKMERGRQRSATPLRSRRSGC